MGTEMKIINVLKSIHSGKTFNDKVNIFIHFLTKGNFPNDTYGQNSIGIFFGGKKPGQFFDFMDFHEDKIEKEITQTDGTFIDIGGFVGKYSIIASRRNKNVITFEPYKNSFKIIKKNLELNNIKNVQVFNLAVSNKEGTKTFYLTKEGSGGHSFTKKDYHTDKSIKIKCVKLDNLKLKNVKTIKIDAEYEELNIIKGARELIKEQRPKIIFECADKELFKQIKQELSDYNIRQIDDWNYVAESLD